MPSWPRRIKDGVSPLPPTKAYWAFRPFFRGYFFPELQALGGDSGARQLLRGNLPITAVNWPPGVYDLDQMADLERMTESPNPRDRLC